MPFLSMMELGAGLAFVFIGAVGGFACGMFFVLSIAPSSEDEAWSDGYQAGVEDVMDDLRGKAQAPAVDRKRARAEAQARATGGSPVGHSKMEGGGE